MNRQALFLMLFGSVLSLPAAAQIQPRPLITRPIDEARLVTLHGSVHPLARAQYDRGAVSASFPAGRMLLLLNRPSEEEGALQHFLRDAHTPGSAAYHRWVAPEEFGEQFGPADSDIEKVSAWLRGMGFQVAGVSSGKTLIEFSGTAGQIGNAFHTQIHKYEVNGEVHYANAADLQIPEALAGIVRNVSAMNDFRPQPNLHVVGSAHFDPTTRKISPDFTLTGRSGAFYALAPEDFATQYDLAPLYAEGVNGTGETIGVINDSNVDLNLDNAYRSLFKLSPNPAQVVLDGGDPGVNGDAIEAYLDTELAGAVAPGATVNLYVASWDTSGDVMNDPLILAAERAIDDNQADVLSVSFGECELGLRPGNNQILDALWEQAAAQGQTVVVSSGDSGSAGCDSADQQVAMYGLQVNGFASTPWDVAVGGTDFYYSDYAAGAPSAANAWNATNDANLGSLKAPLQEQVWDDTYGLDAVNPTNANPSSNYYSIAAGGGGASGCLNGGAGVSGYTVTITCMPVSNTSTITGYSKPRWQSGPGVPSDGVRDLPDVSLFAADGFNRSAYPICASPDDCVPNANQQIPVTLVGGTSASAQAMAGIMALVDQKYGRQGQADTTLYALAQQRPSAFHDILQAGNNVPCRVVLTQAGQIISPNCVPGPGSGYPYDYTLSGYSAGPGYDLASGLGTVDANQLVTNWNSISFAATSTAMQLSSTSFAHGTPATISASVSSSSGGSKPQGAVAILTNSPLPANQSVGVLTLDSKGTTSGTFNSLPGGTYEIWANYGGDATHTGSHSYPVSVTVTPEPSSISISARQTQYSYPLRYNPAVGCTPLAGGVEEPVASGGSVLPYTQLWVTVKPTGTVSKLTTATGTVTFTLDGQPASVPLNEAGVATWVTPATVSSGAHTIVASYSGDASYAASTSAPFTYTVQPNPVNFQISPFAISTASGDESHGYGCFPGNQCSAYAGDNLPVTVFLSGGVCELATGTVTLSLGSQTQNVTLVPMGYPAGQISLAFATFTNLQPGTYQLTGSYSGDANFAAATSASYTFTVAPSPNPLLPTTTAVTVTPSTVSYEAGGATFTVTVTGNGASGPPTGYIDLYADGWENIWGDKLTPSGSNTATASTTIYQNLNWNALGVYIGTVPINVAYLGDSNYQGSASQPITLNVVSATVSPDFILAPQAGQITAQSGSSTTLAINLASVNEFNSAVALSCTPSSSRVSCSLDPSTITVNGQAAATLTIKVAAQTAGLAQPKPQTPSRWPLPAGMLAFCLFLTGGRRYRRFRRSLLVGLCLLASMWSVSCGGGGATAGSSPTPTPAPTATTYSVLVTGTANGIVHNAKITVVVQ